MNTTLATLILLFVALLSISTVVATKSLPTTTSECVVSMRSHDVNNDDRIDLNEYHEMSQEWATCPLVHSQNAMDALFRDLICSCQNYNNQEIKCCYDDPTIRLPDGVTFPMEYITDICQRLSDTLSLECELQQRESSNNSGDDDDELFDKSRFYMWAFPAFIGAFSLTFAFFCLAAHAKNHHTAIQNKKKQTSEDSITDSDMSEYDHAPNRSDISSGMSSFDLSNATEYFVDEYQTPKAAKTQKKNKKKSLTKKSNKETTTNAMDIEVAMELGPDHYEPTQPTFISKKDMTPNHTVSAKPTPVLHQHKHTREDILPEAPRKPSTNRPPEGKPRKQVRSSSTLKKDPPQQGKISATPRLSKGDRMPKPPRRHHSNNVVKKSDPIAPERRRQAATKRASEADMSKQQQQQNEQNFATLANEALNKFMAHPSTPTGDDEHNSSSPQFFDDTSTLTSQSGTIGSLNY